MRVGPFELLRPLARGGMAQVWEARHGSGIVAVKFVNIEGAYARALFADEIRAHARLLHPHVLQVLDMGRLMRPVPEGPTAGTPWLALEYVSGGDLHSRIKKEALEWPEIFTVLFATLDALGHAHSRGVIHRDLKPGNILLAGPDDDRPGLKLADFGIAHLRGEVAGGSLEGSVTGTAAILSPEQCRGAIREYGPWTDLYALGCVATKLATGAYPFRVRSFPEALLAHTTRSPPELAPRVAVPDGFADWVRRLLRKAPRDRFQTAAAAMTALWQLGCDAAPRDASLQASFADIRTRYRGLDAATGTFPSRWRHQGTGRLPTPLVDAGLGLFPLRARPPTGHQDAREQAWAALERVHTRRAPEVLVITGPSGSGLSHLGDWLCETAVAEGLAQVVALRGRADDGPEDVLLRTLERLLQVQGLRDDTRVEGIRANLALHGQEDPDLVRTLTRLLARDNGAAGLRYGALRRLIAGRASPTALLWIDDAHLAPDAMRFVEAMVRSVRDLPLLVVVAMPDDQRAALSVDGSEVQLGPLGPSERIQLLQRLLPLSAPLEAALSRQHHGLGGRLVRALDRVVRSGALELGPSGYTTREPPTQAIEVAPLPAWLDQLPARQRAALLRAALLGSHVPERLWAAACDDPRGELGPGEHPVASVVARVMLLERLKNEGLARAEGDGWRFEHDRVVEAVVASALPERLREAHGDLADLWRIEGATEHRIARHLAAAGRDSEALVAYLKSMDGSHSRSRRGLAPIRQRVEEALAVAERLGLPREDPAWDTIHAWRALRLAGRFDQRAFLETTLRNARQHGWIRCQAAALCALSNVGGSLDAARAALERAPECPVVMSAMTSLAVALYRQGRPQDSVDLLETPLRYARRWDLQGLEELILANRFGPLSELGQPYEPADLEEYARRAEAQGNFERAVIWWTNTGEAARGLGQLEYSDRANQRALALADLCLANPIPNLLNLAVNAFERSDSEQMRIQLDWVDRSADRRFDRSVATLEVCWAALAGDRGVLGPRLESLRRDTSHGDPQDLVMLERAAALLDGSDPSSAAEIRALAALN